MINNDVFQSCAVSIPSNYDCVEIVAIDILNSDFNCRIVNAYRPPSTDTDILGIQYCQKLSECFEFLYRSDSTMILCGDYNVPNFYNPSSNPFTCSNIISNFALDHAFNQYVAAPTRYDSVGNTASLLDLLFCNDDNFIFNARAQRSWRRRLWDSPRTPSSPSS